MRALNCILTIPQGEEITLTSLPGGCFLLKCVGSVYHKMTGTEDASPLFISDKNIHYLPTYKTNSLHANYTVCCHEGVVIFFFFTCTVLLNWGGSLKN